MKNLPINPDLMKQYRDNLLVNSSPAFIDTDAPIVPSVNINTAENPVLTASVERGNLTILNNTTAVTGVAYYNSNYIVPNNKKYVIKMCNGAQSGGNFTITDITLKVYDGTNGCSFYNVAATSIRYVMPISIILPEGFYFQIVYNVTAFVANGNINDYLVVQEYDETQL